MARVQTAAELGQITPLIESFDRSLAAAHKSPRTRQGYVEACNQLAAFLAAHSMPTAVENVKREHIETYIVDLLERFKPATANNRFRALQQFFKWCVDEGEIPTSPMARMQPPRVPEPITPVLSDDAIRKLRKVCAGNDFDSRRDSGIVHIFGDCGLRLAEMTGLRWTPKDPETNDIFLTEGVLRVKGKGRKVRLVGFGMATAKAIDRYLRVRDRRADKDLPAFLLGQKGAMTDSGIAQVIRRRAREAGIGKVHPHQFRHTASHKLLSAGMTEGDLMQHMGWSSPMMAKRYGKSAASERAVAAQKKFSPMDRL